MDQTNPIKAAADWLAQAESIAVLTGAGISQESGVPTFRGTDGLWKGLSFSDLASPEGFAEKPRRVWEWYNWRREVLRGVEPNPGHEALAKLERSKGFCGIITQNVDRLHQTAGSQNVIELHGSIWETLCTGCERRFDKTGEALPEEPTCEVCGERLRPAVVWFGETLPTGAMETALAWTQQCDLFIVAGTSNVVYPAGSLAFAAKQAGKTVIEINWDETPATDSVDISLRGKTGEILPQLLGTSALS